MRFSSLFLLCFLFACSDDLSLKDKKTSERDELDLRISSEPTHLNPFVHSDAISQKLYAFIYDGLVDFPSSGSAVQPALATSWSRSKDGLQYDFQLRKGVQWHDGKAFDALDVKASFDHWMKSPSPIGDALRDLDKIEVVNPYHIRFRLKRPYYRHLYVIGAAWILPRDQVINQPSSAIVGTGPYQFDRWERSSYIRLRRNESYWKKRSVFRKVNFHIIRDDKVAFMALEKGILDVLESTAQTLQWATIKNEISTIPYSSELGSGFSYIAWNLKHQELSKLAVRKALSQVFPWQQAQMKIFSGFRPRALSYFHPNRKIPASPGRYDFKKAQASLEGASLSRPLEFELLIPALSPDSERLALIYQNELEKLGVKMKIRSLEWASFLQKIKERSFDAYLSGWTHAWESDPYHFFHSQGSSNFVSYKNSRVDEILERARTEFDFKQRQKLYEELNRILWEDLPILFLFQYPQALHIKTQNVSINLSEGSRMDLWTPIPEEQTPGLQ